MVVQPKNNVELVTYLAKKSLNNDFSVFRWK